MIMPQCGQGLTYIGISPTDSFWVRRIFVGPTRLPGFLCTVVYIKRGFCGKWCIYKKHRWPNVSGFEWLAGQVWLVIRQAEGAEAGGALQGGPEEGGHGDGGVAGGTLGSWEMRPSKLQSCGWLEIDGQQKTEKHGR